jgi:alpha-tubulin suppressor-like RCC1 family protein
MNLRCAFSGGLANYFCLLGQSGKFYKWVTNTPHDLPRLDEWLNRDGRPERIIAVNFNHDTTHLIEGNQLVSLEGGETKVLQVPCQPVDVVCGLESVVVLGADGSVWTTGSNASGQLGIGTNENSDSFQMVELPEPVVQVASGCYHVLALTKGGRIWAWGENDDGKLGIGEKTSFQSSPVLVESLSSVVKVIAGTYYSFALTRDGQLYAWGWNRFHGLGMPDMSNVETPTVTLTGVIDVAAGWNGTIALKKDGTVWYWGKVSSVHPALDSPVQALLPPTLVPSFIGMTSYQYFVLDPQGSLYYWGSEDGTGTVPTAKDEILKFQGGIQFKVPKNNWWGWETILRWLFLGKGDPDSVFFQLPIEVVFHLVGTYVRN